jgi:hypothetical protein
VCCTFCVVASYTPSLHISPFCGILWYSSVKWNIINKRHYIHWMCHSDDGKNTVWCDFFGNTLKSLIWRTKAKTHSWFSADVDNFSVQQFLLSINWNSNCRYYGNKMLNTKTVLTRIWRPCVLMFVRNILTPSSRLNLKTEPACFIYYTTKCHITEDHNKNTHIRENITVHYRNVMLLTSC